MARWLLAVVVVLAARSAWADNVCIASDAERDRLAADEQALARQVFENVLLAASLGVGAPCDETWTVSHVRLGDSIHVLVTTPRGAFTATAAGFEALGTTYEGLTWRVVALRSALFASGAVPASAPMPARDHAPERTVEPTVAPAAPAMRGAFYARVGYGVAPAMTGETESRLGPTIGIGYRRAAGPWLFDVSIMNTHAWRNNYDYDANVLSFGRLAASRLLLEQADSTWYAGGGVSFGQSAVRHIADPMYGYASTDHGYAVQLEGVLGYELMRDKPVRLFFEGWITAPLSGVAANNYAPSSETVEYWAPTLNFATGIGF